MKQKISVVIDAEATRLLKQKAAEESRSLSDLIREALMQYLRKDAPTAKERKIAYHLFCKRPMKISPKQLRHILKEDIWG